MKKLASVLMCLMLVLALFMALRISTRLSTIYLVAIPTLVLALGVVLLALINALMPLLRNFGLKLEAMDDTPAELSLNNLNVKSGATLLAQAELQDAVSLNVDDVVGYAGPTVNSAVGGVLIMGIGFNMFRKEHIPVGDMLPAIFLPLILTLFM